MNDVFKDFRNNGEKGNWSIVFCLKFYSFFKQGGGKEQYLQAKRNAKRTVYTAKKTAEEKKFSDLKPGMDDIFKLQNN